MNAYFRKSKPTKYYLHGNQFEDDSQRYYCLNCDSFENNEHFQQATHRDSNLELYRKSFLKYKKASKEFKKLNFRPVKSYNLFSAILTLKPSRFYKWLKKQIKRYDQIGDLANDAIVDLSFPMFSDSYKHLRSYLIGKSACHEAIQALYEAFNEFKKKSNLRSEITPKLRFEIFNRDKFKCQICGAVVNEDNVRLEVDHKIPISKGGTNVKTNLWTLCFKCNRGKGKQILLQKVL